MSHDFEKAVEYVRKPAGGMHPNTAQKLRFYGLYKQATEGDNSAAEPSFYQLEAKQKWKAWNELKGMSKEAAQEERGEECVQGFIFTGLAEAVLLQHHAAALFLLPGSSRQQHCCGSRRRRRAAHV
ncbi:hypothetical protein Esti_006006 [Eimeria stiedai]